MKTELFPVPVITLNATLVVYGILFGGIHPVAFISMMLWRLNYFLYQL